MLPSLSNIRVTNGSTEVVESFKEFIKEVRLCEGKRYSKCKELVSRGLFFELVFD